MRLSDALRGAADRAPLDDLEVDVARARRRAATHRGLRTGANGAVACAMVAVVGFGVSGVVNGAASSGSDASGAREESASAAEDSAADAAGGEGDGGSSALGATGLAWGMCGEPLPDLGDADGAIRIDAVVETPEVADGVLGYSAGLASTIEGSYDTWGATGVVLWDGVVVATVPSAVDAPATEPYPVQVMTDAIGMETREESLVNCWDGAPLPAGDYELVLTQELWSTATPDAAASDAAGDAATSDAATSLRLVSDAMPFTVEGERVDDPFADYLAAPVEPAPVEPAPVDPPTDGGFAVPDGALDADIARDLYEEGLSGAWDMAPGTQRWIVTGDTSGSSAPTWYGCSSDDGGAFPSASATIDLLTVDAAIPATIDVSHGWVVEGNPVVGSTLTNISEWDLAGFWSKDELPLSLVRDGRVVAEAYPVDPDRDSYDTLAMEREAAGLAALDDTGTLAAGASESDDYLWRDVNGCWTDEGQSDVEPGTYTVLAAHHLSFGGGGVAVDEPWAGSEGDAALTVAPDDYDAFDLQLWTSLGTVTVR